MSRYVTAEENGNIIEEIADKELCKNLINDVCCNEQCNYLGWMISHCEVFCIDNKKCKFFEKEDGIIDGKI